MMMRKPRVWAKYTKTYILLPCGPDPPGSDIPGTFCQSQLTLTENFTLLSEDLNGLKFFTENFCFITSCYFIISYVNWDKKISTPACPLSCLTLVPIQYCLPCNKH